MVDLDILYLIILTVAAVIIYDEGVGGWLGWLGANLIIYALIKGVLFMIVGGFPGGRANPDWQTCHSTIAFFLTAGIWLYAFCRMRYDLPPLHKVYKLVWWRKKYKLPWGKNDQ